jgi:hypothetical protein
VVVGEAKLLYWSVSNVSTFDSSVTGMIIAIHNIAEIRAKSAPDAIIGARDATMDPIPAHTNDNDISCPNTAKQFKTPI